MSTKPTLHIAMPPRRLSHHSGPRSPRFHEDFDAPFSEAIMNASLNSVAAAAAAGSSSSVCSPSQERPSLDSLRRSSPGSSLRTPSFPTQSPTEQWREFPWTRGATQRKSSVNDRVRGWARRSLIFKSRPASPDEATGGSFSKADHSNEASPTEAPK
ncbi:hypothetical protein ISF_00904 [Cordyceps fumosorosea ARSEF 2679]|uniref:Uncharacterized protein n=1 Tax=Cordyceps fumosorosea (strain ARSEF 2679) TaxID=1081104 RepID=A0A168EMW9_CORFA|nr:hypothetical protein ISF_00904 [Cordyceps fumosorosea ARSEF 2679]OAA74003.1 hypothetical protein ISF_00904 [Cordyceps fumosorosea ARSEF 2679]